MVVILLGNGFEDIEALAPCDILRRGGLEVLLAGVNGRTIVSGRGVPVTADCTVEEISCEDMQQLIIPGGLGGVESIKASAAAMALIGAAAEKAIPIAAICAGPTILSQLGLLEGKAAVCHPDFKDVLACKEYVNKPVVINGSTITGRGAGASLAFGFAVLESLRGKEVTDSVKKGMCYEG